MNIGIKYCGGCNSQYDRVKLIEGFKKRHPENRYYGVLDGELTQDIWIIVCGCPSACACTDGLTARLKMVWVPKSWRFWKRKSTSWNAKNKLDKKEV